MAPVPRTWLETQLPSALELVLFLLLSSEAAAIDYLLLDYMYGNNHYHKHWYMDDEWGLESQVFFFYYQRRARDAFGCKLITVGTFLYYFPLCFY